ncbi:amino acid transporter [Multifurca ochricompacta]|uniref:Amino acid transporter n=1 Tax=Multifurca ochricompacta TaxID=376703 RepID=A0AAD4LX35_9AGAM|nr:amino acid transporter [Multifurca ochricompacta]
MFSFLRSPQAGRSSGSADTAEYYNEKEPGVVGEKADTALDSDLASDVNAGDLTFEEATAGGMGRHLGVFSCTLMIIGRIIGTGIFSTPSSILGSVGSVGASLMLWVAGLFLSFCGLFVWLELGTMFPRSGGEKVYLEAIYRRPKYLATVIFAANAIILGFSAGNCIVSAFPIPNSILVTAGHHPERWVVRGIAIGVIVFTTILHGFTPRLGVYVMNGLTLIKTFILTFIVVTDPHLNFHHAFAGSSHSSNDYATAMFKVIFTYAGWNGVNYVLNDVKNPVRTLKIAGPLGLGITSALYIFANIAYFAAVSKKDILKSGTTVASLFFRNVFGTQAQKALTAFVALRYTYHAARVNQELAKGGVPLPFGNRLWASNWPTQKAPLPGLIIHLIPSVIVIIAPPPQVAYPFILDVAGYPEQIINLFIILGLFYLRWAKPNLQRPFKGTSRRSCLSFISQLTKTDIVWLPFAFFFLAVDAFLLIAPFVRPANKVGDTPPLPYYLYCLIGIAVMVVGVLYWAVWQLVLPHVFKFRLVPRKETLGDGTVVTVFSKEKVE